MTEIKYMCAPTYIEENTLHFIIEKLTEKSADKDRF